MNNLERSGVLGPDPVIPGLIFRICSQVSMNCRANVLCGLLMGAILFAFSSHESFWGNLPKHRGGCWGARPSQF